MSLPHSFPLLSAFPPHPLTLPKPKTSCIFFVSFLTSTSLYSSTRIHMLHIKAHCPSDSRCSPLSYSSLWVTSPRSPSSFWSAFLSDYFGSWNNEENHNTIFSWLLCPVNSLRKLPLGDFHPFPFMMSLRDHHKSKRQAGFGIWLCALPNMLVRFLNVT